MESQVVWCSSSREKVRYSGTGWGRGDQTGFGTITQRRQGRGTHLHEELTRKGKNTDLVCIASEIWHGRAPSTFKRRTIASKITRYFPPQCVTFPFHEDDSSSSKNGKATSEAFFLPILGCGPPSIMMERQSSQCSKCLNCPEPQQVLGIYIYRGRVDPTVNFI